MLDIILAHESDFSVHNQYWLAFSKWDIVTTYNRSWLQKENNNHK